MAMRACRITLHDPMERAPLAASCVGWILAATVALGLATWCSAAQGANAPSRNAPRKSATKNVTAENSSLDLRESQQQVLGYQADDIIASSPGMLPVLRNPARGIPRQFRETNPANETYSGGTFKNSFLEVRNLLQVNVTPSRPAMLNSTFSVRPVDGVDAWCQELASLDRLPVASAGDASLKKPAPPRFDLLLPPSDGGDPLHSLARLRDTRGVLEPVDLRHKRDALDRGAPPSLMLGRSNYRPGWTVGDDANDAAEFRATVYAISLSGVDDVPNALATIVSSYGPQASNTPGR